MNWLHVFIISKTPPDFVLVTTLLYHEFPYQPISSGLTDLNPPVPLAFPDPANKGGAKPEPSAVSNIC